MEQERFVFIFAVEATIVWQPRSRFERFVPKPTWQFRNAIDELFISFDKPYLPFLCCARVEYRAWLISIPHWGEEWCVGFSFFLFISSHPRLFIKCLYLIKLGCTYVISSFASDTEGDSFGEEAVSVVTFYGVVLIGVEVIPIASWSVSRWGEVGPVLLSPILHIQWKSIGTDVTRIQSSPYFITWTQYRP